jgi:Protein of unknown function (DUF2914)
MAGCWRSAPRPRRIRRDGVRRPVVMPLSLPSPRRDRPRRRVEPLPPPLREPPVRTFAFDPDAARQAWRQVARTRGAHAMRLDGREPGAGRLAPLALGLVAVAALLLWWTNGDDPREAEAAGQAEAVAEAPRSDASPARPRLQPEPEDAEPPRPVGEPSFGDASEEVEPPQPRVQRLAPDGTPEAHIKALRKLPHASSDRAPLGGIGPRGMHVDRIAMGTGYKDGACMGPAGKFSARDEDFAHVCFRVVHPRIQQQVRVRWERNGMLVRRALVPIGDSHGYRTRASLPLRRVFRGDWTVRIMSTDGVELAAHAFQVL